MKMLHFNVETLQTLQLINMGLRLCLRQQLGVRRSLENVAVEHGQCNAAQGSVQQTHCSAGAAFAGRHRSFNCTQVLTQTQTHFTAGIGSPANPGSFPIYNMTSSVRRWTAHFAWKDKKQIKAKANNAEMQQVDMSPAIDSLIPDVQTRTRINTDKHFAVVSWVDSY